MSMSPLRLNYIIEAAGVSFDQYVPIGEEGFGLVAKLKTSDFANGPTITLNIYDVDGDLLFTKAGYVHNTLYVIYLQDVELKATPIMAGARINLTLSGAAGAGGGTASVVLYVA